MSPFPDVLYSTIQDYPVTPMVVTAVVLFCVYRILKIGKRDKRMPPGPPTLPVLGNLHQIPVTGLYKKFMEWGEQYGGVYSLKLASSNMIVLYDRRAIHELVDKKGLLYAERPHNYVTDLVTHGDSMVFQDHHERQKAKRKIATHNFSPRILDEKVAPVQDAEVTVLLNDLLRKPEEFYYHIRRTTSSIACILVWGQRAVSYEDFWGHCVYDALDRFGEALEPGANPPVDEFPFLKWLPEFMSPWKTRAKHAGTAMHKIWSEARRRVDERRARGDNRTRLGSLADQLLDDYEKSGSPLSRAELNHYFGLLVEGGAETTSSSMNTLILCLAMNPRVQEKARKEMDAVVGNDRMPEWSDFDKLPFVNSIIKEGMRWRPAAPIGIPHRVAEDDWYEGMLIPKDSTIFIPTWALHHSERHGYDDPFEFKPERYENHTKLANHYTGSSDYKNRDHYGYGSGRRMCPGIHLAERTQWRIAAKLLWAFEILPGIDPATGKPVQLDPDAYVEGLLHGPAPFQCTFKPRSQRHVEIITRGLADAQKFLQPYE